KGITSRPPGMDLCPDIKSWIAWPRTFNSHRSGGAETNSRIIVVMTEDEEQRLAAQFQFPQGIFHQLRADSEALTIRTNCQRREHRSASNRLPSFCSNQTREKAMCPMGPLKSSATHSPRMQPSARSASRNAATSDPLDLKA